MREQFDTPAPQAHMGWLGFSLERLSDPHTATSVIGLRVIYSDDDGNTHSDIVDQSELPALLAAATECVAQREVVSELLADHIEFVFSTRTGFGIGLQYSKRTRTIREWIAVRGTTCSLTMSALVAALQRALANLERLRRILTEGEDRQTNDDESGCLDPTAGKAIR